MIHKGLKSEHNGLKYAQQLHEHNRMTVTYITSRQCYSGGPSIYRGEGPKRTKGAWYIRFCNRLLVIIHTSEC